MYIHVFQLTFTTRTFGLNAIYSKVNTIYKCKKIIDIWKGSRKQTCIHVFDIQILKINKDLNGRLRLIGFISFETRTFKNLSTLSWGMSVQKRFIPVKPNPVRKQI